MEKLRGTVNGGVGKGDAVLVVVDTPLLSAGTSEFFDPKGAEKPLEAEYVEGLLDTTVGGLGSSCNSLIFGGDTDGGE